MQIPFLLDDQFKRYEAYIEGVVAAKFEKKNYQLNHEILGIFFRNKTTQESTEKYVNGDTFYIEDCTSPKRYLGHSGKLWDCQTCQEYGTTTCFSWKSHHAPKNPRHTWTGKQGHPNCCHDWGKHKKDRGKTWAAPKRVDMISESPVKISQETNYQPETSDADVSITQSVKSQQPHKFRALMTEVLEQSPDARTATLEEAEEKKARRRNNVKVNYCEEDEDDDESPDFTPHCPSSEESENQDKKDQAKKQVQSKRIHDLAGNSDGSKGPSSERQKKRREEMAEALTSSFEPDAWIPDEEDIQFEKIAIVGACNISSKKMLVNYADVPDEKKKELERGVKQKGANERFEVDTGMKGKVVNIRYNTVNSGDMK